MLRDAPFVLLEDARAESGAARLFTAPTRVIEAHALAEVAPALEAVRAELKAGRYAAGWLSYEAGAAFEERLARQAHPSGARLLWFGIFNSVTHLSAADVATMLPSGDGAWISSPRPRMRRARYDQAFDRVQHYLRAGDTYQINLSYRADLTLLGDPRAAYAKLRASGGGGWSALLHHDDAWLLSTSPELFFRLGASGAIEAKPMKGTAKRGADAASDRAAAERLRADPKECAENIMIVDLLRNDISKLAARGSVHVPALLTVETYPTLHALTSSIHAQIAPGYDACDVMRALFPCGSITGAPKLRAMEIISELETDARGAYTGSIGWMAPDGSAEFNVAIRTIAVSGGGAEIGLGSAVVIDSTVEQEWEECRAKGAFITAGAPHFDLIETMRYEPGAGVARLDLHMQRLARSAETFGFAFDEARLRSEIADATDGAEAHVVRLTLAADGATTLHPRAIPRLAGEVATVAITPLPVDASDFRLRHKTTLRSFYDDARIQAGSDEVIFEDTEGFLTEGSITNIFVQRNGVLLTPPLARGLLPGVLRAELIASGKAHEADLRRADLEDGFFIGNSVRGLVKARLR